MTTARAIFNLITYAMTPVACTVAASKTSFVLCHRFNCKMRTYPIDRERFAYRA